MQYINSELFRHEMWKRISLEVQKKLKLTKESDGEFYMNFNRDFLKYFGEVEIVYLTPGAMLENSPTEAYDVFPFHGQWRGRSAGGCGNDSIGKKTD